MLKHHNILPKRTNSFVSCAAQIESKPEFKIAVSFQATGIQKLIWLHKVVFNKQDILNFGDITRLLKHYPMKVSRNYFNSFTCVNKIGM